MENDSYRRFLDGDDSGFVEIVRDYKDGLILFLNGYVGDLTVAEELAEDTFVKLGMKRPRFSGRSAFKTWLYAIGRNLAVDYLRKPAAASLEDCREIAGEALLETAYLREERKIAVHKAMGGLKKEYRQVLWLLYFEELSNREAAKILRKSVHNVETLAYRARKALKVALIEGGFSYEEL